MIQRSRTPARRGTVLVLTAICLTLLLMIVGVTLDGGLLLLEKRHAQAVADAAAMAGAADLYKNYRKNSGIDPPPYTAKGSAIAAAKANGYEDDGTESTMATVVVRIFGEKFLSGAQAGQDIPRGSIEVTVTRFQPRYFSVVMGGDKLSVKAHAVAQGTWGIPKWGILALASTGNGLTLGGNGTVNVTTGIIQVNSSDPTSAVTNQNNATIIASQLDMLGGMSGAGTIITAPIADNVNYGVPPAPDPLASLPVPAEPPAAKDPVVLKNVTPANIAGLTGDADLIAMVAQMWQAKGESSVSNVYVLEPGSYSTKGTKLPNFGNGDLVIFHQYSFGNGGIYYLKDGGFSSQGASLIMHAKDTGGMMFYNAGTGENDKISITGNANGVVNLSALESGPYEGLLIFQNRLATEPISIAGNGDFTLLGTIYAPNADLNITGNGLNSTIGSAFVAKSITLGGNGNLDIAWNSGKIAPQRIYRLTQ